jgi:hypothetical protein
VLAAANAEVGDDPVGSDAKRDVYSRYLADRIIFLDSDDALELMGQERKGKGKGRLFGNWREVRLCFSSKLSPTSSRLVSINRALPNGGVIGVDVKYTLGEASLHPNCGSMEPPLEEWG